MALTSLRRVMLVTRDPDRLARFYIDAFGAEMATDTERDRRRLTLGRQVVDLVAFDPPGRPHPQHLSGRDTAFQHIALVTRDMPAAYARLSHLTGWRAISTRPQTLPAAAGGVTAFKFTDPDGHPLELLAFPAASEPPAWQGRTAKGPVLGFDHTAISVADLARTIAFYTPLGLVETSRSLNTGPEQDALDGMESVHVDVVALSPAGAATPHLELLHYRDAQPSGAPPAALDDGLATRSVLAVPQAVWDRQAATAEGTTGGDGRLVRDPDGHVVELIAA